MTTFQGLSQTSGGYYYLEPSRTSFKWMDMVKKTILHAKIWFIIQLKLPTPKNMGLVYFTSKFGLC